MSTTNFTETLGLPQCIATDKVNWLEDFNDLGAKVDTFAKETKEQLTNLESADDTTANTLESIAETLQTQEGLNDGYTAKLDSLEQQVALQTTHNNEQDTAIKLSNANIENLTGELDNLVNNITSINNSLIGLNGRVGETTINSARQLSSEDLNTILETGYYWAAGNNTCDNIPLSTIPPTSFSLEVKRGATGGVTQEIIYGSQQSGRRFTRYLNTDGTIVKDWLEYALTVRVPEITTKKYTVNATVNGIATNMDFTVTKIANKLYNVIVNFNITVEMVTGNSSTYKLPISNISPSEIGLSNIETASAGQLLFANGYGSNVTWNDGSEPSVYGQINVRPSNNIAGYVKVHQNTTNFTNGIVTAQLSIVTK